MTCTKCKTPGWFCAIGGVLTQPQRCSLCLQDGALVRTACGATRHRAFEGLSLDQMDTVPQPLRWTMPRYARSELPDSEPTARAPYEGALEVAKGLLEAGNGNRLRLLEALEKHCIPTRVEDKHKRPPRWTAEPPGIAWAAHVNDSWSWSRRYSGPTVSLDRSAAWISAASSVEVAHCALEHTGELSCFDNAPGYYQIRVNPWVEDSMPNPLGHLRKSTETVWLIHPTVKLLKELHEQGRWGDVAILDSYTADPVRLRVWATFMSELRRWVIETYGRGAEEYQHLKKAYGQAFALMLGQDNGVGQRRTWPKCMMRRADWNHAVRSHAGAMMWRRADWCRQVAPDYPPVQLHDIDTLVVPEAALPLITAGKGALSIDPEGIKLGSFSVKAA